MSTINEIDQVYRSFKHAKKELKDGGDLIAALEYTAISFDVIRTFERHWPEIFNVLSDLEEMLEKGWIDSGDFPETYKAWREFNRVETEA